MITISQTIQLLPNNKQKTYFRKAMGCARLAYNWGLSEWKRRYDLGERNVNANCLRNAFNAIRAEQFPFTYEVTKYATSRAFADLQDGLIRYFKGGDNFPKFKKKRDNEGSFYIFKDKGQVVLSETNRKLKFLKKKPHNIGGKRQYLNVPKLGYVKMTEHLRFNGHLNGIRILQDGDRFFARFSVDITEEEYFRTHTNAKSGIKKRVVGIDMGLKSALILSDGIAIDHPRPIKKYIRKLSQQNRKLRKRRYARTKQESLQGVKRSVNFKKLALKIRKTHYRVANIRRDFSHKVSTIIVNCYDRIGVETLNVKGMMHNHRVAQAVGDSSMSKILFLINQKAAWNGAVVIKAEPFYPSSKTCSCCGNVKENLGLGERVYHCERCGVQMDRDYNAARNLLSLAVNQKIGMGHPESTPADLTALLNLFARNGIATSKVETGRKQKPQHSNTAVL